MSLRGGRSTRRQQATESSISGVVHEGGCHEPVNPSGATNLRINIFLLSGCSVKLGYDDLVYKSSSTCRCFQNLFFMGPLLTL